MKAPHLLVRAPWLLAAFLTACGGGGGGGSPPPAVNTAISSLSAPTNFSFATFSAKTLTSTALTQAVGGFTATDSSKAYVKVWYIDAASARQQLTFMTLATLTALGTSGVTVQVPGGISSIQCEIYDAQNSKTGQVTL